MLGLICSDPFPREVRMSAARFQEIVSDLTHVMKWHAKAIGYRRRRPAYKKLNVLLPPPRPRCNRQQIWRLAIAAAVLGVPQLPNPDMKMKTVLSEQFANERFPTSQVVQYPQKLFAVSNDCSVEGVCLILSVKERNVHGSIPLKSLLPPGHTTSSLAPGGSIRSKRESQDIDEARRVMDGGHACAAHAMQALPTLRSVRRTSATGSPLVPRTALHSRSARARA
jgi:hypothetical protein